MWCCQSLQHFAVYACMVYTTVALNRVSVFPVYSSSNDWRWCKICRPLAFHRDIWRGKGAAHRCEAQPFYLMFICRVLVDATLHEP